MTIPFRQKRADDRTYSLCKYFFYLTMQFICSCRQFIALRKIVKGKQLATYFQPIMDIQSGDCLGYEILNRPASSKLFPHTDSFYEYISTTNHVFAFELFCHELSFKRYVEALKYSSASFAGGVVFLNVHPAVLSDTHYRNEETLHQLYRCGLKPEQIVFEITEKQAVEDFEAFERILSHYRNQGFRIAIDDIGSGYSSLKAIVSLKPEFIKLDRSLIQHIDTRPDQQHIVKMLQDFARSSGTHIIAEGIERPEELLFLQQQRIRFGQGYVLGRPSNALQHQNISEIINQMQIQPLRATGD